MSLNELRDFGKSVAEFSACSDSQKSEEDKILLNSTTYQTVRILWFDPIYARRFFGLMVRGSTGNGHPSRCSSLPLPPLPPDLKK